MNDLFKPLTRDERQNEAIRNWVKFKGKGTIVMGTGVGKTYTAIKAIKLLRKKYPTLNVLVVVPTDGLKEQWIKEINNHGIQFNTNVEIINTVAKNKRTCDLLILDEAHRCPAETFSHVFDTVTYKLILGLTATFERLDNRHVILAEHAPVCDTVTLQEAQLCGWVSPYKDYVVILEVDDIDCYKQYNKEFQQHFEFFDYDFNLAMS